MHTCTFTMLESISSILLTNITVFFYYVTRNKEKKRKKRKGKRKLHWGKNGSCVYIKVIVIFFNFKLWGSMILRWYWIIKLEIFLLMDKLVTCMSHLPHNYRYVNNRPQVFTVPTSQVVYQPICNRNLWSICFYIIIQKTHGFSMGLPAQ